MSSDAAAATSFWWNECISCSPVCLVENTNKRWWLVWFSPFQHADPLHTSHRMRWCAQFNLSSKTLCTIVTSERLWISHIGNQNVLLCSCCSSRQSKEKEIWHSSLVAPGVVGYSDRRNDTVHSPTLPRWITIRIPQRRPVKAVPTP